MGGNAFGISEGKGGLQGSKLKKSLGRLLVTNSRNIVARCKFSVASLYNQINFQVPLAESV